MMTMMMMMMMMMTVASRIGYYTCVEWDRLWVENDTVKTTTATQNTPIYYSVFVCVIMDRIIREALVTAFG
jgi:hypothetical protein